MRRKKKKKIETSKAMAIVILTVAILDLQLIVLAPYFDKIASEVIGSALITEVVGVFAVYCVKAFKAKENEEENKLKRDLFEKENEDGYDDNL